MRKLLIPAVACLLLSACTRDEMINPDLEGKNTVHVSFSALQPENALGDDGVKVILSEESPTLAWDGSETASIVIGKDDVTTSKEAGLQIEVSSTAPGVFENDIDLGSFTTSDVHGIVIPHSNGAYYRYRNSANRLYTIFPNQQTQERDGKLNLDYFPLYARVSYADLTGGNSIQLKAAGNLLRFNVYGTPQQSLGDETLQSIRIHVKSGMICGTMEIVSNSSSYYNGTQYGTVNLTEGLAVNGRTAGNGIKVWMGVMGASRVIDTIRVTTDKAVYTKAVEYTIPANSTSSGLPHICRLGLNLAKDGWTREGKVPGIYYSADSGATWTGSIPSGEFTTLAVKTEMGAKLTETTLSDMLLSLEEKTLPVAVDMSAAEYETAAFPATFKGSSAISSVKFPSNVNEIAASAFQGCSALAAVDLTGLTTIGNDAFRATALTTLEVPSTVANLGERAFGYCYDLTSVYYNSTYTGNSGTHGAFTMREQAGNVRNTPDSPLTVTFGTAVTSVPRYCFDTNQKLVKIIFEGAPAIRNNSLIRAVNLSAIVCQGAPPTNSACNNLDSGGTPTNHFGRNVEESRRIVVIPSSKFKAYNENALWAGAVDSRGFRLVDAEPAFPDGNWPSADPAAHSFSASKLAEIASLRYSDARIDSTTAVVVVAGGDIIYTYENPSRGGIGDASYYIASCRKSMLSMLYGKYVEDGTIDLTQTIGDIGLTDKVEAGYETDSGLTDQELTATVQHLIESRSGIYHKAANDPYVEDIPRDTYAPGEHYAYNNWDFNAAGYVFEHFRCLRRADCSSPRNAGLGPEQTIQIQQRQFQFQRLPYAHFRKGPRQGGIHDDEQGALGRHTGHLNILVA